MCKHGVLVDYNYMIEAGYVVDEYQARAERRYGIHTDMNNS